MDNEGKLKELNIHIDDYATQFLTARSTYYVLKIEGKLTHTYVKLFQISIKTLILVDSTTGEKRYTPNFNLEQIDQKLSTILTSIYTLITIIDNENAYFRCIEYFE